MLNKEPLNVYTVDMIAKKHPHYRRFKSMKERCNQSNNKDYPNYGGRGIKVCPRWSIYGGFWNFVNDVGVQPKGTTLDRINNDGDYSPDNCRWSTASEKS